MTKKKIITLALAAVLVVMSVAGATFAYLTDTDDADNVFTVGSVKIELSEEQRGEKGLEDFDQNKKLYPIVGSAQGELDEYNMPVAKNYVDKIVTVTNTGSEDAYVRVYFAIPSALDDGYDDYNANANTLHFNFGKKTASDGSVVSTEGEDWIWKHDGKWNYFETTMDGIAYNVYFADYATTLAAETTTERFLNGVYLDKSFDMKDDGAYAFGEKLTLDEKWNWNSVKCPVFAVAVQAAGFDSADEAFTNAFGAQYNPWGTTVSNWQ